MNISKSIFHQNNISESIFDLLYDISKTPNAMSIAPLFKIVNSDEFISKVNSSIANKLVLIYVNLYSMVIESGKSPYERMDLYLLRRLLQSSLVDDQTRQYASIIFDCSVKSRLNIVSIDDSGGDAISISYGSNRDASFTFYSIINDPDLLVPLLKDNDYLLFDSVVMRSAMSVLDYEINFLSDYLARNPSKKRIEIFDDSITNFLPMVAKHYGKHELKSELIKLLDAVRDMDRLYGGLAPQIRKCLLSTVDAISMSYSTARHEQIKRFDIPMPSDHEVAVIDMQKSMLSSRDALIGSIYDAPGGPDKVKFMSFGRLSKEDFLSFIRLVCEIREEPQQIIRCIKETINNGFNMIRRDKSCINEIIDLAERDSSSFLMRESVITALVDSGEYDSNEIIRCIQSPLLVEFSSQLIDGSRNLKLADLNEIIRVTKKFAKLYNKDNAKNEWCARMAEISAYERIASCHIYPDIKMSLNKISKSAVMGFFAWAVKNNRVTKMELELLAKSMRGNYHVDAFQDLLATIKRKSTDLHEHLIGCMLRERTNALQEPLNLSHKKPGKVAL